MVELTRRGLLQTSAVGLAIGMAGCVQTTAAVTQEGARVVEQNVPKLDRTEGSSIPLNRDAAFPMPGADHRRSNAVPDVEGLLNGVESGWRFKIGRPHLSQPVVRNGTIAVIGTKYPDDIGYADSELYVLEPSTGELRFEYEMTGSESVYEGAILKLGRVYFGTEAIAMDANGGGARLSDENPNPSKRPNIWTSDLEKPWGSPIAAGNYIITVSDPISITAVDAGSGSVEWKAEPYGEDSLEGNYPIWGPSVSDDGHVVFGTGNEGWVVIYDGGLGEWGEWLRLDAPLAGAPAIADRTAYVGCLEAKENGPNLFAIRLTDGAIRWSRNYSAKVATNSPAVADGEVAVPMSDGTVEYIDAETGETQWTSTLSGQPQSITLDASTVYVGIHERGPDTGGVVGLDRKSGNRRWRYEFDGPALTQPTVTESAILIGDGNGTIHGLH